MKRIVVMTAVCLFAATGVLRAEDTLWVRVHNPGSSDAASAVATIGTEIYVAGTTMGSDQNVLVMRYSGSGVRLWATALNLDTMEQTMDIGTTTDSGAIVGVLVQGMTPALSLVRLNKNGDTVWTRHRRGMSPTAIAVNSQNETYILGRAGTSVAGETLALVKYSATGAVLFDRGYQFGQGVQSAGCALDPDGNLIAGVTVMDSAGPHALITKFNSSGDTMWQVRPATRMGAQLNGIAVAPNRCVLFSLMSGTRTFVMKLSPTGSAIWTESIPGSIMPMNYRTIAVDADSNAYVAVMDSIQVGRVARFNAQGTRTWYGQAYMRCQFRSVAVDADDYPVAVGSSMVPPPGALIVKFSGVSGVAEPRIPNRAGFSFTVTPNPTSGRAVARYSLARPGRLQMKLYDAAGRAQLNVADGFMAAGDHTFPVSTTGLPAGVYYLTALSSEGSICTRIVQLQ